MLILGKQCQVHTGCADMMEMLFSVQYQTETYNLESSDLLKLFLIHKVH